MPGMLRRPIPILLAIIVVIVAGVAVLAASRPTIPAGAASTPVTRTVLTGEVPPDSSDAPEPTGDVDPEASPRSPAGGECLDRMQRGSGWADLCWQAYRYPDESDPEKDYYLVHIYGSFEALRWLVLRSDLVGEPADNVFSVWPDSRITGGCRQEPVDLGALPMALPPQDVCGRIDPQTSADGWTHTVSWTCEACLLPDSFTKGIALYNFVAVPPGSVPSWDIFADAGS